MRKNVLGIKFAAAMVMAWSATSTWGQAMDVSVAEVTRSVLDSANGYAHSIACEVADATGADVAALVPAGAASDDEPFGRGTFAVVWHGDIGCSGGSGTVKDHVAIVTRSHGNEFLVDPGMSSPQIRFEIGVPAIDRLVGATRTSLVFDGRDFCDGESSLAACGVKVRVTMRQDKHGGWTSTVRRLPETR